MTIAEAKQLRIVDYLASLGYHPQSVISKQYWYLSPLRDERTPSFKVNDRLNEWYDFGAATGGDLVELGKYLYRTNSVSEVLACIGRHENAAPIQSLSEFLCCYYPIVLMFVGLKWNWLKRSTPPM